MKRSFLPVLFGLPFAAIGIAALAVAASGLWDAQRMQSWQPVEAQLLTLELETNRGDDSATQRVRARYRYSVAGRSYESERVAIYSFADNIGDFHQQLYESLSAARAADRTVTAWVDPRDPAEAVLSREPRWLLTGLISIFGLVFAAVGGVVIAGSTSRTPQADAPSAVQELHPDEPWRWRDDWDGGIVTSDGSKSVLATAGFAALWILISSPPLFIVPDEIRDGNYAALVALAFPIVGIAMAIWAVNAWMRHRRFGESTLRLDAFPVPVGATLRGEIRVDAQIPVDDEFVLRLSCIEIRRRSGGRNSRSERMLWQDERVIPRHLCQLGPAGSTIPVEFELPADQPGTRAPDASGAVAWRLEVSGACPGADYRADFELPVFAAGHDPVQAEAPPRDYPRAPEPGRLVELAARGIRVDRLPDGSEEWVFGRARHKGVAAGLTVFALVWSGFVVLMFTQGAPVWFASVFGLVAVLILWGAVYTWLAEQRVSVSHLGIGLRGGILPLGRRKQYAWTEIREIKPERGMSSGNKLYYDLKLDTGESAMPVAARSIDSLAAAEEIAASWARFKV